MTFPNEQKVSQQAEMELMVKSSFTDPGSFFGLMSMCAAHRAILAGRHSDLMDSSTNSHRVLHDPDYYIMKANCIRAVNRKMRSPRVVLSDETFDTIINLLISTVWSTPLMPMCSNVGSWWSGCSTRPGSTSLV
jgi:hypothetical protein